MSGRSRDLVWLGAVTFVGGLAAMLPLAALVRVLGGLSAALPFAVFLWSLTDSGAPWIVYYARYREPGDGPRVRYVGMTGPRADGPASVEQRIAEHVKHDVDDRPWKRLIEPGNCTVARRCWTGWGARRSERRRIRALALAGKTPLAPRLRNDVHNRRRMLPLASLLWLAVESRIVPGACWHRTARWVPDGDTHDADELDPEPVERRPAYVPHDDEFGFFEATAAQLRARAQHPSAPVGDLTDDVVAARFAALTAGWDADPDVASTDVPLVDIDVSAGEVGPLDVVHGGPVELVEADGGQPVDTSEDVDGGGDASCDARETPENAASGSSGGDSDTSVRDGGRKRSGGRPAKRKVCVEQGCEIEAVRYSRCADHARAWDRERKRRKREGGDQ